MSREEQNEDLIACLSCVKGPLRSAGGTGEGGDRMQIAWPTGQLRELLDRHRYRDLDASKLDASGERKRRSG